MFDVFCCILLILHIAVTLYNHWNILNAQDVPKSTAYYVTAGAVIGFSSKPLRTLTWTLPNIALAAGVCYRFDLTLSFALLCAMILYCLMIMGVLVYNYPDLRHLR